MVNTKKQIVVLMVIVLVLGLGIGVLAGRMEQKRRRPVYRHGRSSAPETLIKRFTDELHLDSRQQELVSKILEEKKARIAQFRSEMISKFAKIKSSSREEIRAVLNPEQQAKFDKICRKSDKKMREWEKKYKQRTK